MNKNRGTGRLEADAFEHDAIYMEFKPTLGERFKAFAGSPALVVTVLAVATVLYHFGARVDALVIAGVGYIVRRVFG